MPLVMVRIDDRLIHGQVVVGWGSVIRPERILLCSDEVATIEWQKTIYLSAVPPTLKASVLTKAETVESLKNGAFDDERILLLVDSPENVVYLIDHGIEIDKVNVGGMHFKPGKNQLAPFIFVDEKDIANFKALHERGVILEGRDVPTRTPVDVAAVLGF
ncbi:MAG: PTS sugar transporter subunit IIB [candidate division KSB1 bacterium]|nr:PTS sugar transporter subunit IIB [candidate division KSB1 bacterium]